MKKAGLFILIIITLLFSSCAFFEELINPSDVKFAIEAGIDTQDPIIKILQPSTNNSLVTATYTLSGKALFCPALNTQKQGLLFVEYGSVHTFLAKFF